MTPLAHPPPLLPNTRKAYTARTFGRMDGAHQRDLRRGGAAAARRPFKVGNDTIGAIGVSGSTTDGDENCAKVGAAKIADQLR
jgi:uncharacterized protein GlcG (DUF336 family)